ncbi:MAG: VanZ family protein [Bacteroidales bacterium]|nr:VanZ family protein [Bacteroidales bacterium]
MPKFWKSILWALLILIALLIPKNNLPDDNFLNIKHLDKLVHACLFAGLQFLVVVESFPESLAFRRLVLTVFFCTLYAAGLELVQQLLNLGRSGSWNDFLADLVGIILGLFVFQLTKGTKFQSFFRKY